MNAVNKIKIEICGSSYMITSTEEPAYVQELAEHLDSQVKELMASNPSMSITIALILCAMSYLDDMSKANFSADHLRSQIKEYLEDAARARTEADEAKREVERLKRELISLQKKLDDR